MRDLKGKRVVLGSQGSGTEQNALQILEAHGLKESDLGKAERIDAAAAADQIKDGRVAAAFFTTGLGSAVIIDTFISGKAVMVSEELVYKFTKAIFDNPIPLHPGAEDLGRQQVLHREPVAAGARFTLEYVHSSERVPVTGTFRVEPDGRLTVVETAFAGFGPGCPSWDPGTTGGSSAA